MEQSKEFFWGKGGGEVNKKPYNIGEKVGVQKKEQGGDDSKQ